MTTHELAQELWALKELPLANEESLRDARTRLRIKPDLTPEERNQRDIDFGRALLDDLRASEALKQCDNPKLLWLFLKAIEGWRAHQHCLGVNLNIIDQIENRLYPEYDGENIRMTDTGWITPDGPVDYIKP